VKFKRARVQSFASKTRRGVRKRKYSHGERNHVADYVHKFVDFLLYHPLTFFTIERLTKSPCSKLLVTPCQGRFLGRFGGAESFFVLIEIFL